MGTTGFGGPAAHIAMMHDEVGERRKWMDENTFLDLLGATNLIPRPNSTEMAIHIGYMRAGWRGLIVAWISFILPAMLSVMFLTFLYSNFQESPNAESILYGIKPVVIAIILLALIKLGQKAAKSGTRIFRWNPIFDSRLIFYTNPLILLVAGGLITMLIENRNKLVGFRTSSILFPMTPGLVFTTATFIGYILNGWQGAVIATVAIFLPSFIFVLIINPWIPHIRASSWFSGILDGVNAVALGLMAGVMIELAIYSLTDILTIVPFIIALIMLFRFKINTAWLIVGGGLIGIALTLL